MNLLIFWQIDSEDFEPQEATSPTKDAYLINDNLGRKVYHEEKM